MVIVCETREQALALYGPKLATERFSPFLWAGPLPKPMSPANKLVLERAVVQSATGQKPVLGQEPTVHGQRIEIFAFPMDGEHLFVALIPLASAN